MKKLSVLSIFALCAFSLLAQTLPNKCMVSKPSVLVTKMLREADVNRLLSSPDYCQSESRNKMFWIVYSDRDNNVAYTSSTGTTPACTLSMNEKLRIAQIENKRALVYSEPIDSTTYPTISSAAQCIGWVPMEHLLLWDICIADEMGVYQRALLCMNADVKSDDCGYGYMNPSKLNEKILLDPTFKFYYVMKRAKTSNGRNLVLLATHSSMSGCSDAPLYAWVPESMYILWNSNLCIEPTWDKEAVHYFAREKYVASSYDSKNRLAHTYTFKINRGDPNPDNLDDDFYRWPGEVMRYPILDATTDKYYCTGLMGNIGAGWVDSAKIRREELYVNLNVTGLIGFTGSTDKKAYDRDVWKVNVMLTDDELSNLIMRLSPLYAKSCVTDYSKLTRKLYVEWIKDIISAIFSIPLSENMDLDQCVERLNSLYPVAIHQPSHILDSNIINEEQFKVLLSDIKLAYERLLTHRMSYKYSMQHNGQTYYWIPLDEICM